MDELIRYILEKIVDEASQINIERNEGGYEGIIYNIKLAKNDMGKVIGRGGTTISAINRILNLYQFKKDGPGAGRVIFKIEEQLS